jgi:hypothetical protein
MAVPSAGAAIGNTFISTGANAPTNVREDIADQIWRIDPEETPLVIAAGRGAEAEQVHTEWLDQELNAADANVQPEGFRYIAQPAKRPARLGNFCQIMFRSVTVSNTLRASDSVGGDEWTRQMLMKGVEVRRDLEWWVTRGLVRTGTDPRQMSGIQTFITNGSMGAGTGAMPAGDGSNGPVAGTPRTMTLDFVALALQQAFTVGGKPTLGLLSPRLKRVFSGLAQGGTGNAIVAQNVVQATAPKAMTIVGAVDAYLSDFGQIQVAPDIFMPDGIMLLIDKDYVEIAPLTDRDMNIEEYAKTGDAADGGVVFEGTLRVTAPKAHAMVGDLS